MESAEEIRAAFDRCQRLYPTVGLSLEDYLARVEKILSACHDTHSTGESAPGGNRSADPCSDCSALCRQLCHEDLFLATACVRGDRIAWEHFADQYLPLLKRFAAQACRNCDEGEDLAHEIVALLIGQSQAAEQTPQTSGNPGVAPSGKGKLQSYNGRGSLAGWLRAAAAHAAIDRFRRARRQIPLDETEGLSPAVAQNAMSPGFEEERLDARWGKVLAGCMKKKIAALNARDRLILGLYHLHGVPLKAIGRRFGVHEATASRWLERVRQGIRKDVERELHKAHGLKAGEIRSLWRWVAESGDPMLDSFTKPEPADLAGQEKLQGGTI
jgi:RNA polymerase sigma factor (sigma-70 family)